MRVPARIPHCRQVRHETDPLPMTLVEETSTRPARRRADAAVRPSVQFVFALHNHQPAGNFESEFAAAFDRAYAPFLEALEFYPSFRSCLHLSGPLLQWLAKRQPGYVDRLGALVWRGQVELLGGGLYEPILPVIPERDRVGQLVAMADLVETMFGARPRGAWIAERVWEPSLPVALKAAGMEYTVLDDSLFAAAGIGEEGLGGYWLAEEQGDTVAVFPIRSKLRKSIPGTDPSETLAWLRQQADRDFARTAVFADDGEKFGNWPDSHGHCYEEGWMYRFAEQVSNNPDWLRMKTFSEVIDSTEPMGRAYPPAGSYREMAAWATAPGTPGRNAAGGTWRSFLSRYDEANHLHKKMLRVGAKLDRVPKGERGSAEFAGAQDSLWRGQGGDALWHGTFGGVYCAHLRSALYGDLIAAERYADAALRGGGAWCDVSAPDFDADGHPELIVDSPAQTLVLQPHLGGALVEHDARGAGVNVLDTMMRRREAYHDVLDGKAPGDIRIKQCVGDAPIALDWYRRGSFIDHFLDAGATPESFRDSECGELGDFVNAAYACEWRSSARGATVALSREGSVLSHHPGRRTLRIGKVLEVSSAAAEIRATYRIGNTGTGAIRTRFGVEFGIAFRAGNSPEVRHEIGDEVSGAMESTGEVRGAKSFRAVDGLRGISAEWSLSEAAAHWRMPVETVSNSESGLERLHQSAVVMPVWDLNLEPGAEWSVTIAYAVRTKVSRGK